LSFAAATTLHEVKGRATDLSGFVEACFEDDGSLAVDPAPQMHVEFPVERLRSGNDLQDREMWRLIDSKRFPRIVADLRGFERTQANGTYSVAGDLTLAGRTRRYDGSITVLSDPQRMVVDGDLVIDVRDFGLRPPQLLFLKVDPSVRLRLHLVAAA
jgi:polyisoprenoid-binding protein YceI